MQICNFIKSESLAQLFSCEICEICRNTFFAENHRTTASDYSSINKSEEETLESEEVLESLYNKFSGLKVCNSIKKRQVFSCGNCNFSNNTFFTEQFQWLLLRFNSYFQRTLSNKYHIQLQKKLFAAVRIQKQPPQVFCKRRPATLLERGSSIACRTS